MLFRSRAWRTPVTRTEICNGNHHGTSFASRRIRALDFETSATNVRVVPQCVRCRSCHHSVPEFVIVSVPACTTTGTTTVFIAVIRGGSFDPLRQFTYRVARRRYGQKKDEEKEGAEGVKGEEEAEGKEVFLGATGSDV